MMCGVEPLVYMVGVGSWVGVAVCVAFLEHRDVPFFFRSFILPSSLDAGGACFSGDCQETARVVDVWRVPRYVS